MQRKVRCRCCLCLVIGMEEADPTSVSANEIVPTLATKAAPCIPVPLSVMLIFWDGTDIDPETSVAPEVLGANCRLILQTPFAGSVDSQVLVAIRNGPPGTASETPTSVVSLSLVTSISPNELFVPTSTWPKSMELVETTS